MHRPSYIVNFNLVVIFILSLLLASCGSSERIKVHLVASVGTYTQQVQLGSSDTVVGTSLMVKLQGDSSDEAITLTLTGPKSWNGGKPYTFIYPAGSEWVVMAEAELPPLAGEYLLEADLDKQQLSRTVELMDATTQLELTDITATLVAQDATSTVDITWTPVAGANGYFVKLLNGETGAQVVPTVYTLETEAQFDVSSAPSPDYVVAVYSMNVDTVTGNPALPAQFNLSDSIAVVTVDQAELGTSSELEAQNSRQVWRRAPVTVKP